MRTICAFLLLLTWVSAFGQNTLTGHVYDKESGKSLPGVNIYLPDLKTGTSTDENGHYTLHNLPGSTVVIVQVSLIGYKAEVIQIIPGKTDTLNFHLLSSPIETKEVVVTGNMVTSENDRSSISITPLNRSYLLSNSSTNLISSIAAVPGVSEITTGGEISKPVIRGLGYTRIVTMNEGVRQEGNQWGDEHGIEIDEFSADRIEVIKGPASLFYGSDAMGGVINILEPAPAQYGSIGGELVSQFSTNNRLFNNSLMVEGNQQGWIWRIRGSYKTAASYRNAREWVYNSGFSEKNYSILAGVTKKWGYTHFHFSSFNSEIGMIDGIRDSLTGNFLDYSGNVVSEENARSRELEVPFQKVDHNKLSSVSNFLFGKNRLMISLGYQVNNRREFGETSDSPGLFLNLGSLTWDIRYTRNLAKSLELVVGVSGMKQLNRNFGNEFLIPDYDLQSLGGFGYLKKTWEKFTFNLGFRYDTRDIVSKELFIGSPPSDTIFKAFSISFSAFTGSSGFTWRMNKQWNFKFNLGRGFRAPNIAELSANGLHEGTFRYEIGNSLLIPETSLQIDGEISWENRFIEFTFNGFYNIINNYIYYRNENGEKREVNGVEYPVYRYTQGNSLLKGFEIELDIHPLDRLHLDNSLDYVWGQNTTTSVPLPFIPALHLTDQVKWTFKTGKNSFLSMPYIQAELETHFAQDRIDEFETNTPGYVLLNFNAGTKIFIKKQSLNLFISGKNLLNKKYYDHLSRLKEIGIYNMGSRIIIGLQIPMSFALEK